MVELAIQGRNEMATRKVYLTRWYANDTSTVEICASKAAAERIVESYLADGVFPYLRTHSIERVAQEAN